MQQEMIKNVCLSNPHIQKGSQSIFSQQVYVKLYKMLSRNLTRTMTSTRRVAMYVAPVMVVSICLNIPKFMETQATQTNNSTRIGVTDMRLNPTYMLYYTISQIFHPTLTTGIIPMVALIFMNTSIFFGKTCFS